VCEKIETTGATTFRDDRDIDGGDDIPDEIRRQIKKSKELVVILTPESINRPWVTIEVGAAWLSSKLKRIVILLCQISVDPIPPMLKSKKAIHLNDLDSYLNELAHRVGGHHG
jgi:hypothetical protein